MTDLRALLAPLRSRLEPALFHAPYIVDGRKVIQANNHPSIRPYMLSDNSMPVIAEFIANAPTDLARLLAAIEAVAVLHKPVTYWMTHEDADVSYQNKEDALWCRGDLTEADLVPFELCTHCKMIEDSPCDGECTGEAGYREAPWPCPTITALAAALGSDTTNQEGTQ